jgi:hypothetical protein
LVAKEEEARRNTADGGVGLWNEKTKSRTGILEMGKDGEEGGRGERECGDLESQEGKEENGREKEEPFYWLPVSFSMSRESASWEDGTAASVVR